MAGGRTRPRRAGGAPGRNGCPLPRWDPGVGGQPTRRIRDRRTPRAPRQGARGVRRGRRACRGALGATQPAEVRFRHAGIGARDHEHRHGRGPFAQAADDLSAVRAIGATRPWRSTRFGATSSASTRACASPPRWRLAPRIGRGAWRTWWRYWTPARRRPPSAGLTRNAERRLNSRPDRRRRPVRLRWIHLGCPPDAPCGGHHPHAVRPWVAGRGACLAHIEAERAQSEAGPTARPARRRGAGP